MRKVKSFLHVFASSLIPKKDYYPKILRAPFIFSVKYFISLIVLLNVIFLLFVFFQFNPVKTGNVLNSTIAALKTYPEDLKIIINKGTLITSYNRPYFLWLDYQDEKKLIVVIDESALPSKIYLYNSIFLITQKEIVMKLGKNDQISTLPLSYLQNEMIEKNNISQLVNVLEYYARSLLFFYLILFIILIIIAPTVSLAITFLYIFLAALLAYLVYHAVFKKKTQFRKTLQISLHAVTLPLLLNYILIVFRPAVYVSYSPPSPNPIFFPIAFLALLSIFILSGIYQAHAKS